MTPNARCWTRKHSLIAMVVLMTIQIYLIDHFRTGLVGSDDMTAAFTGKRLINEFDMTVAFTNLPMSMRIGMGFPLGILQLIMPTDTALWVFPLLCAIPLAPLSYRIARLLQLSRPFSLIAAAILSCTPAIIFNSSVALTEVPLLVVTLAALLCFLKGLPEHSPASQDAKPQWRYGWLIAAGAVTGLLFSIKVSAVTLIASLVAYAFLRQIGQRRKPWAAVAVGCGFALILVGEMSLWTAMSGDPLFRTNRIKQAATNSQKNMRDIYQQTSDDDLTLKYSRYLTHFSGYHAPYGNLFLLFFLGWGLACLFAKRYRLFLLVYAGPQLVYLWYLVTFYPSTQPRYAIQILPFLALGTLLLFDRWRWSRTSWGTAIVVLLVGQNLTLGMVSESNQYQPKTVFFSRYSHDKIKDLKASIYVDGRTVSIIHTLNNFSPGLQERLWQYPVYRDMKVGERRIKEKKLGVYPWRETNLENAHGFVMVDFRLARWLQRRLKSPKAITVPPPNWILADYAFPDKTPSLGGLVFYASPDIKATKINDDPNLKWLAGKKWYRARNNKNKEKVEISKEGIKFKKGDLLILGKGNVTRPGIEYSPEQSLAGNDVHAFVEFDCIVKPKNPEQALYVPWVRLFEGKETAVNIRFPAALVKAGRHTLRFPIRLSEKNNRFRFSLKLQQDCHIRITAPRIFAQQLGVNDQLLVNRYDGVSSKYANIASNPSLSKIR